MTGAFLIDSGGRRLQHSAASGGHECDFRFAENKTMIDPGRYSIHIIIHINSVVDNGAGLKMVNVKCQMSKGPTRPAGP